MSKGTLELLPGCASVVLERVAAIQAFALRDRGAQVRSGEDKRSVGKYIIGGKHMFDFSPFIFIGRRRLWTVCTLPCLRWCVGRTE